MLLLRCTTLVALLVLILAAFSFAADESVSGSGDLTFGTMFPGIPKTIDKSSTSAAEFTVGGDAGTEVTLDFSLPTYLSSGGNTIQLIFFSDGCAIDSFPSPNQASPSYDDLNPWQTLTYNLGSAGLTVWLGGKAVPGLRQPAGSYTADIVLTVEYTGF